MSNVFLLSQGYTQIRELGAGSYGTVYLVDGPKGQKFAVKQYRASAAEGRNWIREDVVIEADTMRRLTHPNLVHLVEVLLDRDTWNPYLVLPLSTEGDLYDWVKKTPWDKELIPTRIRLAHDILCGLAAMHAQGIVHRDIKPENILVFKTPNGQLISEISDFGTALRLRSPMSHYLLLSSVKGSAEYTAPEIVCARPYPTEHWSPANDMWAMGVVLMMLFLGDSAFSLKQDDPSALDQYTSNAQVLGSPSQAWHKKYAANISSCPLNEKTRVRGSGKYSLTQRYPGKQEQKRLSSLKGFYGELLFGQISDLIANLLTWNPDERWTAEQALRAPLFDSLPKCPPPAQSPQGIQQEKEEKKLTAGPVSEMFTNIVGFSKRRQAPGVQYPTNPELKDYPEVLSSADNIYNRFLQFASSTKQPWSKNQTAHYKLSSLMLAIKLYEYEDAFTMSRLLKQSESIFDKNKAGTPSADKLMDAEATILTLLNWNLDGPPEATHPPKLSVEGHPCLWSVSTQSYCRTDLSARRGESVCRTLPYNWGPVPYTWDYCKP